VYLRLSVCICIFLLGTVSAAQLLLKPHSYLGAIGLGLAHGNTRFGIGMFNCIRLLKFGQGFAVNVSSKSGLVFFGCHCIGLVLQMEGVLNLGSLGCVRSLAQNAICDRVRACVCVYMYE